MAGTSTMRTTEHRDHDRRRRGPQILSVV